MLTLVTVIYGEAREYRVELFGSVLSLLKHRRDPDTRIVVYTDRPLDGFPLPVTQRIISQAEWSEWTRGSGITHLVKLHLVRQTLDEGTGPVIYFDTDTLFLCPPELLAARMSRDVALMHAAEGPIARHEVCAGIVQWLGNGRDVCGVSLSGDTLMHNSGIVGVVPEHRDALLRSVNIADTLFKVDPIFSLDQLSTGASLSATAKVATCEQDVFHYWGWNRKFIRDAIDRYWESHAQDSLAEMCAGFDPASYGLLPHIHANDRLRARWLGWRHNLSADGRFACLALLSGQRSAATDAAMANAWAAVSLNFVGRIPIETGEPARLIALLGSCLSERTGWLDSSNSKLLADLKKTKHTVTNPTDRQFPGKLS